MDVTGNYVLVKRRRDGSVYLVTHLLTQSKLAEHIRGTDENTDHEVIAVVSVKEPDHE